MQIHNKTTGTRGIVSGWEEAIRFRDMITKKAETEIILWFSPEEIFSYKRAEEDIMF